MFNLLLAWMKILPRHRASTTVSLTVCLVHCYGTIVVDIGEVLNQIRSSWYDRFYTSINGSAVDGMASIYFIVSLGTSLILGIPG